MENNKITFSDPENYLFGLELNQAQFDELESIKEWGDEFNAKQTIKQFHKSISAQQIVEEA